MRLSDESGRSEAIYGYDEYGQNIRTREDIFKNPMQAFGFTGYQMDEAGGLYFAQARRYDAGLGRFISEDIMKGHIAVPFTMNHYNYCWNRPLNFVDLNGLSPEQSDYLIKGNEAHRLLQAKFMAEKMGGQVEYPVTSGITSNVSGTGRADIVYFNLVTRTVEVYEIKPLSYAPGAVNYEKGKSQLDGYVDALRENGQIINGWDVQPGFSLNSYFNTIVIPSVEFPNKEIVYCVYENGLINYYYRNKKEKQPEPSTVVEKEEESEIDYSAIARIGCGVAGLAVLIGLGVFIVDNFFVVGAVDDGAIPVLATVALTLFTIAFTGKEPQKSCEVY